MAVGEFGQLDLPEFFAGLLVDCNAAPVNRADKDLAPTDGDTTAIGREQHLFCDRVELRLITPDLDTGPCVERGNPIAGSDRVNHTIDDERCFLKTHSDVAALMNPGDLELAHIPLVDLIERAVAPPVIGAVVLWPIVWVLVPRGRRLCCGRSSSKKKR